MTSCSRYSCSGKVKPFGSLSLKTFTFPFAISTVSPGSPITRLIKTDSDRSDNGTLLCLRVQAFESDTKLRRLSNTHGQKIRLHGSPFHVKRLDQKISDGNDNRERNSGDLYQFKNKMDRLFLRLTSILGSCFQNFINNQYPAVYPMLWFLSIGRSLLSLVVILADAGSMIQSELFLLIWIPVFTGMTPIQPHPLALSPQSAS